MGETLDAAPHAGLAQGRTSDAKPGSILRGGSQGNVSQRMIRPLSRDHRSVSLLIDLCALGMGFRGRETPAPPALLCRHSGMEGGVTAGTAGICHRSR